MTYDVVIPIYDLASRGIDRLFWQLVSLTNQRFLYRNIFIIDGSREPTQIPVSFAGVEYIHFPQLKFNKPILINIGIKNCDSKYVVISDVDSLYPPQFSERYTGILKKDPDALIVSGSYKLPEGYEYGNLNADWFNQAKKISEPFCDTSCGGVQAIKRDWLITNRGIDERYQGWGGMDGDLLKRVRLDGKSVVWIDRETDAYVLHQYHPLSDKPVMEAEDNREILEHQGRVAVNPSGWAGDGEKYGVVNGDEVIGRALLMAGYKLARIETEETYVTHNGTVIPIKDIDLGDKSVSGLDARGRYNLYKKLAGTIARHLKTGGIVDWDASVELIIPYDGMMKLSTELSGGKALILGFNKLSEYIAVIMDSVNCVEKVAERIKRTNQDNIKIGDTLSKFTANLYDCIILSDARRWAEEAGLFPAMLKPGGILVYVHWEWFDAKGRYQLPQEIRIALSGWRSESFVSGESVTRIFWK
jgi:glycosyltransferase involved in cell wall biosynthesis